MHYALGVAGMRSAEVAAVERGETTIAALMEQAGHALSEEVLRLVPLGPVVVVTGKGNNGGDGWVTARRLKASGRAVSVLALATPDSLTGHAASAAGAAVADGVTWSAPGDRAGMEECLEGATVVVDAIFGVGFSGTSRSPYAAAIEAINATDAFVVSVDIPSGVNADTGCAPGPAIRADVTVTFSVPKIGLLLYPGATLAGEVVVADVGLDAPGGVPDEALEIWDRSDYQSRLPLPAIDAHKGDRGSVLLVAGSRLYAGSAVLAAAGAMRMGAGYVFAAVPASVAPVMQAALPHVIAVAMTETAEGTLAADSMERILRLAAEVDAVVLGPGLTTHAEVVRVVRQLVKLVSAPLVLDADGLNALVGAGLDVLTSRVGLTVITPHPGELARLLGTTSAGIQADRFGSAGRIKGSSLACVLKGAHTLVAGEGRTIVTLAGNPGMATAGSGDVLAGMIGALLGQGLVPFDAGALGAYLHARAGDLAAAELTEICLTAKDLPGYIPRAVRETLASAAESPLG